MMPATMKYRFLGSWKDVFEKKSAEVAAVTGHDYALYAYDGHPEATDVIVVMGSAAVTCSEVATHLVRTQAAKVQNKVEPAPK
eukprot:1976617-Amphidinium_carterae.1